MEDYTWLWYDVRPHPKFGTVEVRVCDSQTRVEHTLALAALVQAMVKELCEHYDAGGALGDYPWQMLDENKWLAARHGLEGELVDLPSSERVGHQGAGAAPARPPARARPGPRLGGRARGDRRPPRRAATAPSASSSSTRPTTTCARSWPRSSRRRRPTAPRPARSAARAGGARRARSRPASAGSRRRWRRS